MLKRLEGIAVQVNAIEEDFQKLTDEELRAETDVFRKRLEDGETLDDIQVEAFAAVREAAHRTLGQRPYDLLDHYTRDERFLFMQRDAQRFLPAIAGLRLKHSLFEVKAVPNRHELDDGRPIMVRRHSSDPLCVSVLGAKLDSVFELEAAILELIGL